MQPIPYPQQLERQKAKRRERKQRLAAVERDPLALRLDPTLLDDLRPSDYLDLPLAWLVRAYNTATELCVEAAASTDDGDREAFFALVRVAVGTGQALAARRHIAGALLLARTTGEA